MLVARRIEDLTEQELDLLPEEDVLALADGSEGLFPGSLWISAACWGLRLGLWGAWAIAAWAVLRFAARALGCSG